MNSNDKLERVWKERPEIIRNYFNLHERYDHLCQEVAYILKKRLTNAKIEISNVTYRAKTVNSFVEKISRKNYEDPFTEITDIAGVRVVFLYNSDFPKIDDVIYSEFEIIEKVDKVELQGSEKFGYSAIHYLVKLGKSSSGARYDDLKDLICEIQVRTVLQDAWAIVDHHLIYKRESDIPTILKRKLNSLSGLFEIADEQFDTIRSERQEYIKQLVQDTRTEDILEKEINLDTVMTYLQSKFPNNKVEGSPGHLSYIMSDLDPFKFHQIKDIEQMFEKTSKAREAFNREHPIHFSAGELAIGLAFADPNRRVDGWEDNDIRIFNKYEYLIE